jgi:hypothetical protein
MEFGRGAKTLPCKKIVEKPPRNSAGFYGGGQGLSWAVEPRKEGSRINEEIRDLYRSPCIVRKLKSRSVIWAGYVARMRDMKNAYIILAGKPLEKRVFGAPRRGWEDDINMDLRDICGEDERWMEVHSATTILVRFVIF